MTAKRIFLIAGEQSGDLHGALLVKALKKENPGLSFYGLGGKAMENAGVKILYDLPSIAALGLGDVLRQYFRFRKVFYEALRNIFSEIKPDLIILIDYPGFNIRFAKKVRKRIPVVYYISPQVWAWGKRRIGTIAKFVNKMLVFLPFEPDVYRGSGLDCEFIGHPLIDLVKATRSPKELRAAWEIEGKKVIALLPGSRIHEVQRILPVMLKSARLISEALPDAVFLLAESRALAPGIYDEILKEAPLAPKRLRDDSYNILSVCDFALVTSGTATLETTISLRPFVILYKAEALTYFLGKNLVRLPYIGLTNVIAGRKIVQEFIQHEARPEAIAKTAIRYLTDMELRDNLMRELEKVRQSLGKPGAVERAARTILNFLEKP